MDFTHFVIKPRLSEKAYNLSQGNRTYVFEVPADVNKLTVKQAVEKQFDVTVESVNVLVAKGKTKRGAYRKGRKWYTGTRSDVKKAYVVLKEGDQITVFKSEEAEAPKETK